MKNKKKQFFVRPVRQEEITSQDIELAKKLYYESDYYRRKIKNMMQLIGKINDKEVFYTSEIDHDSQFPDKPFVGVFFLMIPT